MNDKNTAIMNGGHKCLLVFEFVRELETRNNLAGNFVSIGSSRSHSPIEKIRRMNAEHPNFERIIDLANIDFGDTTTGRIGIRPFSDQRRELKFVDAPIVPVLPGCCRLGRLYFEY